MNSIFDVVSCPVCGSALERVGGSLKCLGENKSHTFDIASSGYVNLLPPGKKKNSRTGDNDDMVRSRLQFLNAGLYDKISDKVSELIEKYSECDGELKIVDSGCGEGYHTCRIAQNLLKGSRDDFTCAAFDASKRAVMEGAKKSFKQGFNSFRRDAQIGEKNAGLYFFAGNIFSLPVMKNSANVVLSMFAPISYAKALETASQNGVFIITASGKNHLIEMRGILYDEVKKTDVKIEIPDGFSLEARETLRYSIELDSNEMISNLLKMTPFFYKSSNEKKEKLLSLDKLTATVETENFVLKKI